MTIKEAIEKLRDDLPPKTHIHVTADTTLHSDGTLTVDFSVIVVLNSDTISEHHKPDLGAAVEAALSKYRTIVGPATGVDELSQQVEEISAV